MNLEMGGKRLKIGGNVGVEMDREFLLALPGEGGGRGIEGLHTDVAVAAGQIDKVVHVREVRSIVTIDD